MRSFIGSCLAALLLACGGDQAQPQPQPEPTAQPTAPTAEPKGGGEGGGAAIPEPDASAKPVDGPPPKPKPSGRPAILMGPSKKIESTFGATPGAVLKLAASNGTITWKIPEFSLNAGYNIEWKLPEAKAIKKKPPVVGDVAYLKITLGDKLQPTSVSSKTDEFELRWPLGNQPTVNLAVGTGNTDSQGDELKEISWKIIAPKSVDTNFKEAYFYLQEVGPLMYLHATSAPATEAAPPPPAPK